MVAERLALVRERIAMAAGRAGRDPADVTLVVVSKARTVAEIETAYTAGQRDFGENRAEELALKAAELPVDIRWHFVGSLQRRKIALVRAVIVLLHSMDRESLASRWTVPGEQAPPSLLQINIGGEAQKHGVERDRAAESLAAMAELGVHPVGLMVIPPAPSLPEDSRSYFVELVSLAAELRHRHPGLVELSMGMTDDFEVAVEEGATLVRVGRAIFGPRTG